MLEDEIHAIVVDNGSDTCKAGFAGDCTPRTVFSSVVGRTRLSEVGKLRHTYVGDDAQRLRCGLALKHPIQRGNITNWDDMEMVWSHMFYNELNVHPDQFAVLITEASLASTVQKEKTAEIIFESFQTPALYLANQSVLSLYSAGEVTGFAIHSGHGITDVVPVYEGYALSYAVRGLELAGHDLTDYLEKIFNQKGCCNTFKTTADREVVSDIKKTQCYVALDIETERKSVPSNSPISYELPDGQVVEISAERYECPEILFQPSLLQLNSVGIHEMAHDSIMKCDADIRPDLYKNIVLSGGSTLFRGFSDRVRKEISALNDCEGEQAAVCSSHICVTALPEKKYSAWNGGSMLASVISQSCYANVWISKQEYNESGSYTVNKKCF